MQTSWTTPTQHASWRFFNIRWQDKIPDTEVLARVDLPTTYTMLMQSQLRWAGHLVRMPDHWQPKRLFYGELQHGKRSHGGQKKRFKDTLKRSLKVFDINPDSWEQTAMDRAKWHSSVHKGAKMWDQQDRRSRTKEASKATKESKGQQPSNGPHDPLSPVPSYLPCADRPHQPCAHPPIENPTQSFPGWLERSSSQSMDNTHQKL